MLALITQKMFFKISGTILFAYFIGAIPFSSMISSKYGKNLFNQGSKKAGAANVLRTSGIKPAIFAFTADFTKGSVTILVARFLGFDNIFVLMIASSTILGHWKSIFNRMRGGDGFATLGGITLVMYSLPGVIAVVCAFLINYFSKFFKYPSTLCIPAGYFILVLYTKNMNSQIIGMGILYSLVFLKSNSTVFKLKFKNIV
jgi:glycerol-3-phosphate acyltransferase PlsY